MFEEEWKTHPWCDGRYQISNLGRVKRNSFVDKRRVRHEEKELTPGINKAVGYRVLFTSFNGKKTGKTIHSMVADLFVPNPKGLKEVNHKDGDKANPVYTNLEWCTHRENILHAIETGLMVPLVGSKSGNECAASKLTEDKVAEIKRLIRDCVPDSSIAKMFGVVAGTIGHIKSGKTWRNVSL